jgi:branched-chain amino acid transport system permease protein
MFNIVVSSNRSQRRENSVLVEACRYGGLLGIGVLYLAAVGALTQFAPRWIIEGLLTLSQMAVLLLAFVAAALLAGATARRPLPQALSAALLAAALGTLPVLALVAVGTRISLRQYLVGVTPDLLHALVLDQRPALGGLLLFAIFAGAFLFTILLRRSGGRLRRPLVLAAAAVLVAGLLSDLLLSFSPALGILSNTIAWFVSSDGVSQPGAVVIALATFLISTLVEISGRRGMVSELILATPRRRRICAVLGVAVVLALPLLTNQFIAQICVLVGLYALMGMGLNIELGMAGLIDLGFVAFFAIGAYTVGLLSGHNETAIANLSFWACLPIAVLASSIAGLLFGLPVLRVRGDYLAVATLGLGEIIRVLVVSDMMRPLLGGAQGLVEIPKPSIAGVSFNNPIYIFYLTAALAGIAAWCAWRLDHSRIGREWMALREDEDVAEALGIDPVKTKMLAYVIGAAFAGAAGAVFAAMLGSVFPHSFQLLISMNVLALLVAGGAGSLPGVFLGAAILVGLPELMREFGEYRYLFYGFVLVIVMRMRPEGLWPAAVRIREGSHVS